MLFLSVFDSKKMLLLISKIARVRSGLRERFPKFSPACSNLHDLFIAHSHIS